MVKENSIFLYDKQQRKKAHFHTPIQYYNGSLRASQENKNF